LLSAPLALMSLNVALSTFVSVSLTDAFIRRFPAIVVSFVGLIIETFGLVLSMVMDRFWLMFVFPAISVAFTLRLYCPSFSVAVLIVAFQ